MIGWFYLVANHSLSESQPLKFFYFRQVVVSAKCLFGEKSVRQTFRSSNCPFDKMFVRQNVRSTKCRSAKCPFGKMSFGKVSFGKVSFGKTSGHPLCDVRCCIFALPIKLNISTKNTLTKILPNTSVYLPQIFRVQNKPKDFDLIRKKYRRRTSLQPDKND